MVADSRNRFSDIPDWLAIQPLSTGSRGLSSQITPTFRMGRSPSSIGAAGCSDVPVALEDCCGTVVAAGSAGGVGADVVVEAAGYADTFNMCFRLVRQNGTCIIFGIQEEEFIPLEHNWLMDKQPRIVPTTGARSGDPISHIQEIVALRERGWCDPSPLVTHKMGFSDVQKAYDMYDQRQDNIIKVVMDLSA